MSELLKNNVCLNPFRYLDVQETAQYVCCPSWCPTDIRSTGHNAYNNHGHYQPRENLTGHWRAAKTIEIRESVMDGSYRHCNHKVCPSLSSLLKTGETPHNFMKRADFEEVNKIRNTKDLVNYKGLPEEILFGFDRICNLKCPSCRVEIFSNDGEETPKQASKRNLLAAIETHFGPSLKKIMVTGSGDPFYSNLYRDYLLNFDAQKYPKLEEIKIISNGIMLNENLWSRLKAKPFIKTIEISIDAGTQHTYENVTRLNGTWEKLINNLNFLSTVPIVKNMVFSMVVSQHNFREMEMFYNLINGIFAKASFEIQIAYRQIVFWESGLYKPTEIKKISVFEPDHPLFSEFMDALSKIDGRAGVNHNFHHLLGRAENSLQV